MIIICHTHICLPDAKRYRLRDNPLRPRKGKASVENSGKESLTSGVSTIRVIRNISLHGLENRYLIDSAKANKVCFVGRFNFDTGSSHGPREAKRWICGEAARQDLVPHLKA